MVIVGSSRIASSIKLYISSNLSISETYSFRDFAFDKFIVSFKLGNFSIEFLSELTLLVLLSQMLSFHIFFLYRIYF